jgi:hypothetical protein
MEMEIECFDLVFDIEAVQTMQETDCFTERVTLVCDTVNDVGVQTLPRR